MSHKLQQLELSYTSLENQLEGLRRESQQTLALLCARLEAIATSPPGASLIALLDEQQCLASKAAEQQTKITQLETTLPTLASELEDLRLDDAQRQAKATLQATREELAGHVDRFNTLARDLAVLGQTIQGLNQKGTGAAYVLNPTSNPLRFELIRWSVPPIPRLQVSDGIWEDYSFCQASIEQLLNGPAAPAVENEVPAAADPVPAEETADAAPVAG